MKMMQSYFVGALPPPIHGMSLVNKQMNDQICARSDHVYVFNMAPSMFADTSRVLWILGKGCLVFYNLVQFVLCSCRRGDKNLYLSFSGGKGQLFELPYLGIARLFSFKIFIHHHSFAYFNKKSLLTEICFRIAGPKSKHIILGEEMGEKLTEVYRIDSHQRVVLSNVVFVKSGKNVGRSRLKTVGFLSNISFEKGIREFVDTLANNPSLQGVIAGPCLRSEVRDFIDEALQKNQNLQYIGPIYGDQKESFLEKIDVLLFPTSYINEAEPVTIYEALSHGSPVIAKQRGCINGMLKEMKEGGVCIPQDLNFCDHAGKTLQKWQEPQIFGAVSEQALGNFLRWQKINKVTLKELIEEICS